MQVNIVQGTPEWHSWRQSGIGASDVAAIMGISPWRTAIDVFNDKLGLKEAYSTSGMARGNKYEEEAFEAYKVTFKYSTPYIFERSPCFCSDELSWAIASPDAWEIVDRLLIEIKVPSEEVYEHHKSGMIAPHYMSQVQWQLFVTGFDVCHFVVYSPEKKEYKISVIQRDDAYIATVLEKAAKFWDGVCNARAPESDKPQYITLEDPQLHHLAYDYKEMAKESKRLDRELKALREKIIEFGDDSNFRAYGIKATWNNPRSSYDMQSMKDDGIDIEKYKKSSGKSGYYTLTLERDD